MSTEIFVLTRFFICEECFLTFFAYKMSLWKKCYFVLSVSSEIIFLSYIKIIVWFIVRLYVCNLHNVAFSEVSENLRNIIYNYFKFIYTHLWMNIFLRSINTTSELSSSFHIYTILFNVCLFLNSWFLNNVLWKN